MAVNNLVNITIQAVDKVKQPLEQMKGSFTSFGEKIKGIGNNLSGLSTKSGLAFAGLSLGINSSLNAANDLQASLIGLESVVNGQGQDFEKAKKFLQSYTSDGLVTMGESATALKNLLARGFGLEEASQMMLRFKDSASFGRQSALGLGEAIKGATEGLKNENSMLVDNAGVTKNVSKMWEDYAGTLGKSANDLTLAEKRQAEYNGIMQETKFQVGDAAKLTDTFSGKQAILNAQLLQTKQQIGEALQPVMAQLLETITPVIAKIKEWITENPKLTSNIIVITTAILGFGMVLAPLIITIGSIITLVGSLGTALNFLALTPIGLLITAITALIGVIVLWVTHWDEMKITIPYVAGLIRDDVVSKFSSLHDSLYNFGQLIHQDQVLIWGKIKESLSGIWGSIKDLGISVFKSIKDELTLEIQGIIDFATGAYDKIKSLFSSISSTASKISNSVGNVVSSATSSITGKKATGGSVFGGGNTYLVGENGPELFTPLGSGYITSNNKLGGGNMNVNINFGGVIIQNQADENRLIQKMKEELIRTIQLQKIGISI